MEDNNEYYAFEMYEVVAKFDKWYMRLSLRWNNDCIGDLPALAENS